jgi:hypothetical protein
MQKFSRKSSSRSKGLRRVNYLGLFGSALRSVWRLVIFFRSARASHRRAGGRAPAPKPGALPYATAMCERGPRRLKENRRLTTKRAASNRSGQAATPRFRLISLVAIVFR